MTEYRSQNQEEVKQIMDTMTKAMDSSFAVDFATKYLYMDDLYAYELELFKQYNAEVAMYRGDVNSPMAVLLDDYGSDKTKDIIGYLKEICIKIPTSNGSTWDYNKFYVTCVDKMEVNDPQLIPYYHDIVNKEMNGLKPEAVLIISDNAMTITEPTQTVVVSPELILDILRLRESGDDPQRLSAAKNELWQYLLMLIPAANKIR